MIGLVSDLVRSRGKSAKHILGPRMDRPTLVLESDDWGSERIPSAPARAWLLRKGLISGNGPYDYESLESATDLSHLSETLERVRDGDGRPAVFTCYVNPANPDFPAIRESGFTSYCPEPLGQALERRGDRERVERGWKEGQDAGVLCPEYHGREHLQVRLWMRELQRGGLIREAFERGIYSVPVPEAPPISGNLRAAFYFDDFDEIPELSEILLDGMRLFEAQFGRAPRAFCPPNNVFHPLLFPALTKGGCSLIVRPLRRKVPNGKGGGHRVFPTSGALAGKHLHPIRRNVAFEPRMGIGVDRALRGIASAFAWRAPAVVTTHRVNYVGGLDASVRAEGLSQLHDLLKRVIELWPNVRFASSAQMVVNDATGARHKVA